MWIRAGTAFRKSRVLRGVVLAVLGFALQMASVLLMQAMLS